MAHLILSPGALRRLNESALSTAVPTLEVKDDRSDYDIDDGDGLWIPPFLEFLEDHIRNREGNGRFSFSGADCISTDILDEVKSLYLRALFIEFINAHYEDWRDTDVDIPDRDRVRERCRDTCCYDCESGWEDVYGEYDGPLAEDVDEDEDVNEDGISLEEHDERCERNRDRGRERHDRRAAQKEAESEVVARNFVCAFACDAFTDDVNDRYRDDFSANIPALERRWKNFLVAKGENRFPPLHTR